jgi:hypothetical protein
MVALFDDSAVIIVQARVNLVSYSEACVLLNVPTPCASVSRYLSHCKWLLRSMVVGIVACHCAIDRSSRALFGDCTIHMCYKER